MDGTQKIFGFRFSPTVQELLLVCEFAKAPITLENVDWNDEATRKTLYTKSPTGTLPYLETNKGVLSESRAISTFIAESYKPELLGSCPFEKAQVRQWIDFATHEIYPTSRDIIYPIFGWSTYDKEASDKSNNALKNYLKILDSHLNGKKYLVGDKITIADVTMFSIMRFFFQMTFVEGMRKSLLKNVTQWFTEIMNAPETIKIFGRTILCKNPVKPFQTEKKKDDKKEEKKDEKKKKKKDDSSDDEKKDGEEDQPKKKAPNPLDLLPPSKLELEAFKRAFLNEKDKKVKFDKFWNEFDPQGYSLYKIEYQMLESEGKILFRTSNSKSFFLQKLDTFRKYSFAAHGVYGTEGHYVIKGLWMWRGCDIPQELKDHDNYPYLTLTKINPEKPEDRKLVEEYWGNVNEGEIVEGIPACDIEYFN